MQSLTVIKNHPGHREGQVIEVDDARAARKIEDGVAEPHIEGRKPRRSPAAAKSKE